MRRKILPLLLTLVILASVAAPIQAASYTFEDVPADHWANPYVEQAYAAGWVHGMGGNKYDPTGTLTRAQFLTMITNAFYSDLVAMGNVPDGYPWYTVNWWAAQSNNLNNGTSMEVLSDLTEPISRYDMAQVIVNTLSNQRISAAAMAAQSAQADISDWSSVPDRYRHAVSSAYALGILNGRSGGFAGQETMNRAEGATVLCRIAEAIAEGGNDTATPTQTPSTQTPGTEVPAPSTQTPSTQTPDTATQTPESQPAIASDELTAEVVRLVNAERAKEGLSPLGTFDSLTKAAQMRAPELVTLFSHDRPDGTECFSALDETGASDNAFTMGENIAAGSSTAAGVVEQWMKSPGHRANILNPDFTHIGVGCHQDSNSAYGHYWVQMFVGIPG